MHDQAFGPDNLMTHERAIYDEVQQIAADTGRDPQDVLLERCDNSYYGARIAKAIGGPSAFWDFHARHTARQLARPENQRTDGKLVRDMSNGRIGVVRAEHDGRQLVEFAGGTEVMAACDLQEVSPDPDVQARARLAREAAERARTNAANCPDPQAAARWRADAERAEQQAAHVEASSMDWLAEPGSVYGSQGPPAVEATDSGDDPRAAQAAAGGATTASDDTGIDEGDYEAREAAMVAAAVRNGGILAANPSTNTDRFTMGCLLGSGVFELVEEPGRPSYVKLVGSAVAADDNEAHSDPADEPESEQPAPAVDRPESRSVEAFMDAWSDAFTAADAEGRDTQLFAAVVGAPDPASTDAHQRGMADGYAGGPYDEDQFTDPQHGAAYRAGLQQGRTTAIDEELIAAHGPQSGSQSSDGSSPVADQPAVEAASDNGHDDSDGM